MRERGTLQAAGTSPVRLQPAPYVVQVQSPASRKTARAPAGSPASPTKGPVPLVQSPVQGNLVAKESVRVQGKRRPPVPSFPKQLAAWEILRRTPLTGAKKEEDNYAISDKEESSDEGMERAELRRREKRIPAWCLDYSAAIEAQAAVDPDSIFGVQVPICDLDDIFPDSLYAARGLVHPKRKRGSSCQWKQDALRPSEVVKYREKMGQRRRWSMLRRGLLKNSQKTLP